MITLDTYGEQGLKATFAYNPFLVDKVKKCLGFMWNKESKAWVAEGPEVILDIRRNGIDYKITERARRRVEEFYGDLAEINKLKEFVLPEDQEFAYQEIGAHALAWQRRGILADDMGLGKTKQALDACKLVKARKVVVVALKTLVYNWRDELQKWYPGCPVVVLPDAKKKRAAAWESFERGVVITNYEKLLSDDWPFDREWDVLIFDEAQRIKNRFAISHQKLRAVANHSRYVWALTGTPLEIRLEELHGIMALVRPALFGGLTRFRAEHMITDAMGNVVGSQNHELLLERLGPWMTRRTKSQVQKQLPPKLGGIGSEQPGIRYAPLTGPERVEYERIRNEFEEWMADNDIAGEASILTQLLRLQQFTSSPNLLTEDGPQGSKFEALEELLHEWPNRAVVFTRFEQMASRLQAWLSLPAGAIISGKVAKAEDRNQRIKDFNNGLLGKILVSTDAGAYGLNITGADLVVHYDMLWNPAKMRQREDRLHRIGQKSTVNVVSMISPGTIDNGMLFKLRERQDLFDEIIEGAEEHYIKKISGAQFRRMAKGDNPWAA